MIDVSLSDVYDRYQASWVRRDWDVFRSTLHEQYVFSVGGAEVGDQDATVQWSSQLLGGFSEYEQEIVARYPSAGVLVVEAVATGICNGKALSPNLPVPEPGREIRLPYAKILRFEHGLIRDDRQYHDVATLMRQLY
ncbi:ester cyclase [Kribbella sp. NPDC048915]|uniref:nuclear transport factor 2 family protein n=1 Tax=Kribbella sp. NPDC048915 TaxID=3155148 RepID=UPI0033F092F5